MYLDDFCRKRQESFLIISKKILDDRMCLARCLFRKGLTYGRISDFPRETFAVWLYNWKLCNCSSQSCSSDAFDGKRVDFVQIDTPKGIILNLEPEEAVITEMSVTCAIRKDSGDDPDDTNGILIYATVEKQQKRG